MPKTPMSAAFVKVAVARLRLRRILNVIEGVRKRGVSNNSQASYFSNSVSELVN